VAEADTAMGKMKAGFGAAGDYIKANAAAVAATAGASLVAFAVRGVNAFNDLALSASKFADATGLAVEDASRWIEVAGDIGVEAGTIEGALNKMNKAIGSNSTAFAELGAEVKRTNSGAVDVNKTFLNVVDRLKKIDDPAKRAALASQILGKSWTDMAELIQMGSDELGNSLAKVSDAKTINQSEVEKAKNYRAAMDNFGDSVDDLALALGEHLVPALAQAAEYAARLIQITMGTNSPAKTGNVFLDLAVRIYQFANASGDASDEIERLDSALGASRAALNNTRYELLRTSRATKDFDEDLNGLVDSWDRLLGRLNIEDALASVTDAFNQVYEAAGRALAEGTPESAAIADAAIRDLYREVADYIKLVGDIPTDIQTEILLALDEGDYAKVKKMLDDLSKTRLVNYRPTVNGQPIRPGDTPSESRIPRMATGGIVTTPTIALIGEAGPEAVVPLSGGRGMGNNVTVNVYGSVTTENDLVETIRRGLVQSQRSGYQLVY